MRGDVVDACIRKTLVRCDARHCSHCFQDICFYICIFGFSVLPLSNVPRRVFPVFEGADEGGVIVVHHIAEAEGGVIVVHHILYRMR